MEKRTLGQTGLNISPLGLGTVKFGRNRQVKYPQAFDIPEEGACAALVSLARDLGINLIDTSPAYGVSEERLGRILKPTRKDWVIMSKAGETFTDGKSAHDFSSRHFESSLKQSLKNLQTDYIDIFLIHSDGRDVDILSNDELIETLQDFKRRGLVRAIGASTKTAEGGMLAVQKLDVVMATYTGDYLDEKPALDMALASNKGVILKKALGSGHRAGNVRGAMDFAFSHPSVTAVITGTINPEHLRENAATVMKALSYH